MYLSSDFVTAIKRRAAVPTAQITFQNSDFYQLIDEEIRSKMIPLILSNLEELYVRQLNYPIQANQSSYLIPSRAIASSLRDVMVVSSTNDLDRRPLDRLAPEDLYTSTSGGGRNRIAVGKNGFYLEGNNVILFPTPTAAQNILRLSYYCRPNSVVDVNACAQVQTINSALNQITVASLPTSFSASTPLDFVKANPGFECSALDQVPATIVGMTLTFSNSLPKDLAIGDYICLAGQSCVIQAPVELQPLLVQYVTVRILSSQGDTEALRSALSELEKLEKNANLLISPRVIGKAKRVINSKSVLRFV